MRYRDWLFIYTIVFLGAVGIIVGSALLGLWLDKVL